MKANITNDEKGPGLKLIIQNTKISEKNCNLLFELLSKAKSLKNFSLIDAGLALKPTVPQEDQF